MTNSFDRDFTLDTSTTIQNYWNQLSTDAVGGGYTITDGASGLFKNVTTTAVTCFYIGDDTVDFDITDNRTPYSLDAELIFTPGPSGKGVGAYVFYGIVCDATQTISSGSKYLMLGCFFDLQSNMVYTGMYALTVTTGWAAWVTLSTPSSASFTTGLWTKQCHLVINWQVLKYATNYLSRGKIQLKDSDGGELNRTWNVYKGVSYHMGNQNIGLCTGLSGQTTAGSLAPLMYRGKISC